MNELPKEEEEEEEELYVNSRQHVNPYQFTHTTSSVFSSWGASLVAACGQEEEEEEGRR